MTHTVNIYTVHSAVPQWYLQNQVFVPFLVGDAAKAPDVPPAIATDCQPPTLNEQHSFAEMRCHYHVWKHPTGADYVGFLHYDRSFVSALMGGSFPEVRTNRETFMRRDLSLTTRWFTGLVDHGDIIVPRKWPATPDLGTDYAASHSVADWQMLLAALPSPDLAVGIDYLYRANMFVMRADLFDAYMTWWDGVMTKVATAITPPAEGDQSLTFALMSERLLTMWVALQRRERPDLRIIELPLLVGDFTAI